MGLATDMAKRNLGDLQQSLSNIFLSIGNAYYDANKAASEKPLRSLVSVDADNKIKQSRTTFLDCLDQLEISVMRATEVLERRARQQHPELFAGESHSGILVEVNNAGPSPGTMLLNATGLIDSTDIAPATAPQLDLQSDSRDLPNTIPQSQNDAEVNESAQVVESAAVINGQLEDVPSVIDGIPLGAPAIKEELTKQNIAPTNSSDVANPSVDDDLMNFDGTIDFGEMDFDNFNFDDTAHFDFGSMMED